MAMKKGLKIAIGLATVGVVGTGLYFLWAKVLRKKLLPSKEEEKKKVEEEKKKANPSYTPKPSPYASTPFKNKTEGNKFRKWINETYPQYAKDIDLDMEGAYNNDFIRKAYQKYGADFVKSGGKVPTTTTTPTTTAKRYVYVKGSYANMRSSAKVNNGWVNNLDGKVSGKNKKIGTFVSAHKSLEYGDKKVWYKVKLLKKLKGKSYAYVREDSGYIK